MTWRYDLCFFFRQRGKFLTLENLSLKQDYPSIISRVSGRLWKVVLLTSPASQSDPCPRPLCMLFIGDISISLFPSVFPFTTVCHPVSLRRHDPVRQPPPTPPAPCPCLQTPPDSVAAPLTAGHPPSDTPHVCLPTCQL